MHVGTSQQLSLVGPSHFDLCVDATRWAVQQSWCDMAAPEVSLYGRLVCDVLSCGYEPMSTRIIEVKRTRSDLLADLRAKKMHAYGAHASHCYLALGPNLFDASLRASAAERKLLEELPELGLPDWWGVVRIRPGDHRGACSIRRARLGTFDMTRDRLDRTVRHIGRSATWRMVREHQGRR